MALSSKQHKTLIEAKEKFKVMNQVTRLEKEISSLRKKLETKESKMAELIDFLDDKNSQGLVGMELEKEKLEDL